MEYYAIDRIEGNYAVCEKDGETMVNISRALLPDGAGEGNVLRRLPDGSLAKAATITLLGLIVVAGGTFALCLLEPQTDFLRLLFEQISAYSTAGLSTGITAGRCAGSRVLLLLTMFIGRVGAVTLLSLGVERPEPTARYTEEAITIG